VSPKRNGDSVDECYSGSPENCCLTLSGIQFSIDAHLSRAQFNLIGKVSHYIALRLEKARLLSGQITPERIVTGGSPEVQFGGNLVIP
jgi:hypothetical protein